MQKKFQEESAIGMHNPVYPFEQSFFDVAESKLIDPRQTQLFHQSLDNILGKPLQKPKINIREETAESKRSLKKSREKTQSFVSDSILGTSQMSNREPTLIRRDTKVSGDNLP